MRLMRGDPVTSTEVKAADEMIEAARATAKDDAPIGITVKFVDSAGGEETPAIGADGRNRGIKTISEAETIQRAAARALLPPTEFTAYAPVLPQNVVTPAADAKPEQVTSSGPACPILPTVPTKKDLAAVNASFHANGFVREARAYDGWMSNFGAMSRRRAESKTAYEPWPNPTRSQ
jgi:hypothetical protein